MKFQKSALASLSKTPLNEPTQKYTIIRCSVQFLDSEGRRLQDTGLNLKGAKFSIRKRKKEPG